MTVAMSLLVHGEAVRFNRGQSRGDDFDFKYMKGRDGREYPYVSSQCYKKYWREALTGDFSPIIREKDAVGKEKNQAFTSGNPIEYLDDDLFGYMIAGATEDGDDTASGLGHETKRIFEAENIKDADALARRLLDDTPLSQFILSKAQGLREMLATTAISDTQEAMLNALDEAARTDELPEIGAVKSKTQAPRRRQKATGSDEIQQRNKKLLLRLFSKELQEKPKRDTTKRTAPVRMHALVAFSGIKTAKDFQTFSRDIAYTGKNSIVNPAAQGIYSGWLKTRILIESHRIGKFYVGKNLDILKNHVGDHLRTLKEANPYSRGESVEYVQLDDAERTRRLRAVLRALADIGNRQGPASGALHDGSLRPKAFVAGIVSCADSPFDYIWMGRNDDGIPQLDVNLLRESIKDWEDLFAIRKIYVGLPVNAGCRGRSGAEMGDFAAVPQSPASDIKETIEAELKEIGFEAIVDTPRKALLRLSEEATL